jgi:hypothetical protein
VAERPAADLTEFNRAHIEIGEIATVLDLRFADSTVVRVRQQGANFGETNARQGSSSVRQHGEQQRPERRVSETDGHSRPTSVRQRANLTET